MSYDEAGNYHVMRKERPNCRKRIMEYIQDDGLSLEQLAGSMPVTCRDGREFFLSEDMRIQARKMMTERSL